MYRVVLIDDEAVILEGLKRVVKWENYDCQVVGTAFDAKSGRNKLIARVTRRGHMFKKFIPIIG